MSDVSEVLPEDSILTSIKKLLGIGEDCTQFDMDVKLHTNTALAVLTHLGVGPSAGFKIKDKTTLWSEFIPPDKNLEDIVTYVYIKVKLIFDPPLSAAVIESYKEMLKELTFYINVESDTKPEPGQEV